MSRHPEIEELARAIVEHIWPGDKLTRTRDDKIDEIWEIISRSNLCEGVAKLVRERDEARDRLARIATAIEPLYPKTYLPGWQAIADVHHLATEAEEDGDG